jgi:hypothetical protein
MTARALTIIAAEGLADGLMPEADAEDRHTARGGADQRTEMPASFGVQGPGEMTMRSGASARPPRR